MSKENFRFYVKVRTALNLQARVIYEELHSVFGNEAPPLRTVERWSKWFREGREEVEDEARSMADQSSKQQLKILNKSVTLSMMILIVQLKNCRNKLV